MPLGARREVGKAASVETQTNSCQPGRQKKKGIVRHSRRGHNQAGVCRQEEEKSNKLKKKKK